jgi:hypothetical protein
VGSRAVLDAVVKREICIRFSIANIEHSLKYSSSLLIKSGIANIRKPKTSALSVCYERCDMSVWIPRS